MTTRKSTKKNWPDGQSDISGLIPRKRAGYQSLLLHTHCHVDVLTLSTPVFLKLPSMAALPDPSAGWNEALDILAQIKASEQTQEGRRAGPCSAVWSGGPPGTMQCLLNGVIGPRKCKQTGYKTTCWDNVSVGQRTLCLNSCFLMILTMPD